MKSAKLLKTGVCAALLGGSIFAGGTMQTYAHATETVEKVEHTTNKNQVNDVSIKQLKPNVWMHTSIGVIGGNRIPANGLILETSKGLVLIDTPWNDELTEQLLQLLKKQFPKKEVTTAIVTHAHDDRVGGMKTLSNKGVKVHSTPLTADLAEQQGFKRPLGDLKNVSKLQFGDVKVETFYPGKGHTEDNIVVWLPQHKMLFGGCLVKSLDSKSIVQTPGSYVAEWPQAIKKVSKKYNGIKAVVPGHGDSGDARLLTHTIDLLKATN
ncbi:subclass B1 metallo-beta-lactamase [Paenibacillus sp. 481]|nr:subclass B1 metallo-beta-lactamase [Paenibacillus sp. 481]UHA75941.1 subclass B1 metallo-beta-lactamase [Paenibacillus sp. 481]